MFLVLCNCDNHRQSRNPLLAKQIEGETLIKSDEFSNMFSSYRFIPLETKEGSIINGISEVIKHDSLFLVKTKSNELLVFDQKGLFVRKIGSQGRGPDEYLSFSTYDVSEDGSITAIGGNRTIYFYSTKDGRLISKKTFEFVISTMKYLPDNTLLLQVAREPYVLVHVDPAGKVLKTYGKPNRVLDLRLPFPFSSVDNYKVLFRIAGTTNFYLFDYKLDKFSKGAIMDGENTLYMKTLHKKLEEVGVDGYVHLTEYLDDFKKIHQIKFLNAHTIYMLYSYNNRLIVSLYNLQNRTLLECQLTDRSRPDIIDDILFIDPNYYSRSIFCSSNDGSIISFIDANSFLNKFNLEKISTNINLPNLETANNLFKIVDIDSNPILLEFVPIRF